MQLRLLTELEDRLLPGTSDQGNLSQAVSPHVGDGGPAAARLPEVPSGAGRAGPRHRHLRRGRLGLRSAHRAEAGPVPGALERLGTAWNGLERPGTAWNDLERLVAVVSLVICLHFCIPPVVSSFLLLPCVFLFGGCPVLFVSFFFLPFLVSLLQPFISFIPFLPLLPYLPFLLQPSLVPFLFCSCVALVIWGQKSGSRKSKERKDEFPMSSTDAAFC